MYKPLPESVTIKPSGIHDLGLFAKEKIKIGHDLGISHLKIGDQLFRTPLGGFINHSETPNCIKTMVRINDYKVWHLVTLDNIKEGEELTLEYTFYKIYE